MANQPMDQETADKMLHELKRIAEALETLALKADPEFQPKSVALLMRPRKT
jgi:hypothetical protein